VAKNIQIYYFLNLNQNIVIHYKFMKKIILAGLLLISLNSFSQKNADYVSFVQQIKKDAKIDTKDQTVLNLLTDFYEQILQSESGELQASMSERIQKLYADKDAKNLHILNLFLAYQEHISQTAVDGKVPDATFQNNLLDDLETELQSTFGVVPVIIKIYKVEALQSAGKFSESSALLAKSLQEFPKSVPLKVYSYLDTRNESLKKELLSEHASHWMVQQFQIK
jgi:hypothetical protein